ncbi:MAG: YadA C-terminal domain-containing protein [Proteobacteria bacterium]|nr:YadA C-terminal domain-containing protein [Pseudomonadota bacterium]
MPQSSTPGKSMMSAGVGAYGGQAAIAVGLSTRSKDGKWIYKINGSVNTQNKIGIGVGAGFEW